MFEQLHNHIFELAESRQAELRLAAARTRLLHSRQATQTYRALLLRGRLERLWARLTGYSTHLLNLAEATKRLSHRYYAGIHEVPIEQIRGTEGRRHDFDWHFRPLGQHTRQRWLRIFDAYQRGEILPPVELIRVGELYFVRDGHHRISVARTLGCSYVDAVVTVNG